MDPKHVLYALKKIFGFGRRVCDYFLQPEKPRGVYYPKKTSVTTEAAVDPEGPSTK